MHFAQDFARYKQFEPQSGQVDFGDPHMAKRPSPESSCAVPGQVVFCYSFSIMTKPVGLSYVIVFDAFMLLFFKSALALERPSHAGTGRTAFNHEEVG